MLQHCLAGWECSQPSMLPTASTVDLQQATRGIRGKQSTVSGTVCENVIVCVNVSMFSIKGIG